MKQALKTPKCSPICGLGWQNTRETKFVAASRLVDIAPHRHWDKPPPWQKARSAPIIVRQICKYTDAFVLCMIFIFGYSSLFRTFVIPKVQLLRWSVIPKVRYSEGSLFRRFVIPKVRYSEGSLFRKRNQVRYSEGSLIRKRNQVRYSEGSLFRRFIIPKVRYSEHANFLYLRVR